MKICKETCGEANEALIEKTENVKEFYDKFSTLLRDKPYILQKCSLHGTVLVKEIISKAREEANEECQENLAIQIKELKDINEQLQAKKTQDENETQVNTKAKNKK